MGIKLVHYISNSVDPLGVDAMRDVADLALVLVIEGRLDLGSSSIPSGLGTGDIVFCRPGDLALPLTISSPCEYAIILFASDGDDKSLVFSLIEREVQKCRPGLGFTREQFERRFESDSDLMRRSAESYVLSFLFDIAASRAQRSSSPVTDSHLANAISYMKDHLHENIGLDQVAEAVSISKTHLIRVFRKEVQCSPMRYLRSLRVDASASLLSGTNLTLGQVAERLNFYSDSHFSKVFKQGMGENPSTYRHTYIDSFLSRKKRSFEELERSYRFIQQLIDATNDLVFFKNAEGRFLGCNASLCNMVGMSHDEIIGKKDSEIFSEDMAQWFVDHDKEVMVDGKTHKNEEWIRYKDGKNVLFEVSKSPFLGLRNEIAGLIGISRDITERRMVEERLVAAKEEAERSRRDTTDEVLLAVSALLNLTAKCTSYVATLTMSEVDPANGFSLGRIGGEISSMTDFLVSFSEAKRIEIGDYEVTIVLFSLRETISTVTEFATSRFPFFDLTFVLQDDMPMHLLGCRDGLKEIMISLIRHAFATNVKKMDFFLTFVGDEVRLNAFYNGPKLEGNRKGHFHTLIHDDGTESRSLDIYLTLWQDLAVVLGGYCEITNSQHGVAFLIGLPMRPEPI